MQQTIDLKTKSLGLASKTLVALKHHFAMDATKMTILDAIGESLRQKRNSREALDSLIHFCEQNIDNIYELFSYDKQPIQRADRYKFFATKPVGNCQKSLLSVYMANHNRTSDDSGKSTDKEEFMKMSFSSEALQNFHTWKTYIQQEHIGAWDTKEDIDDGLFNATNRDVLEFVRVASIPFSSVAKMLLTDTLLTSISDLKEGRKIEGTVLTDYEIIVSTLSQISDHEIAVFENNIKKLSKDEKDIFDEIFVKDYEENDYHTLDYTDNMETAINIILPLVKAIWSLGKDDSLSLLIQAIMHKQINLEAESSEYSIANITKSQIEREELLA